MGFRAQEYLAGVPEELSLVERRRELPQHAAHVQIARPQDGDLDGKVARIEEMDAALPALLDAKPDVLVITGDHSTPPSLKAHSWHPVPLLMAAPSLRGGDGPAFDEIACRRGQIGTIPAKAIVPLAMAHAGKLAKFGA